MEEKDEIFFDGEGNIKLNKRGRLQKKDVCHDCLNMFDPKFLFKVTRNNYGIPHSR
jgi:hypothetical protein